MSHRELPRSGRGCLAAVVGLPLAAAGGVAALVFAFDHPGPSPSAAPPVTVHRTLVSVRTEVRHVPLPPVVVHATPAPRAWGTDRSPVPSPERREPRTSEVAPRPSTQAVGPRPRVEPPPTDVVTTTESVPPTTTTEVPVTTTIPPTSPTTGSGEQGVAPEAAFADAGRDGEVT
ncbi:hypothetical protein ACFYOT_01420 [Saccharothrix saharensis]|uniref:hypothetical protein n=1 Tax=Saccharothrix saharensis TaxID=571190 RepID=UPI0036BB0675